MAVRGGSNIGLIISNIMFALAFITALVLVINVDAKKEEARQEAQAAKANLVAAIGPGVIEQAPGYDAAQMNNESVVAQLCLLYTSPSPRDSNLSRMPASA